MGDGIIYAVKPDGTLLWYNHTGYRTGESTWTGPITVGSAWDQFSKIMPAGNGAIVAIRPDGALLWYRHQNYLDGVSFTSADDRALLGHWAPIWEGSVQIGSGWTGFLNVIALLPASPEGPH